MPTVTTTNPKLAGCPISLASLQRTPSRAEETECFTATVRLHGRPVASASNDGRGGSNLYHVTERGGFEEAKRWAADRHPQFGEEAIDIVVSDLIGDAEETKIAKRNARQGFPVTLIVPCDPFHMVPGDEELSYAALEIFALRSVDQVDAAVADVADAGPHYVLQVHG